FLGMVAQQSGRAGINVSNGDLQNTRNGVIKQLNATRNYPGMSGISTYAYAEPCIGSPQVPDLDFYGAVRKNLFPDDVAVPEATWLTRPSEGIIKGVVARDGKPVDGATVTLGDRTTHTDGTGFYAFA